MSQATVTAVFPTRALTSSDLPLAGNDGGSILAADITADALSLSVADTSSYNVPCMIRVGNERMRATARSTTSGAGTLTVTRAEDGSAATSHRAGSRVMLPYVAYLHNRVQAELISITNVLTGGAGLQHGLTIEATGGSEVALTLIQHDESSANRIASFKREAAGVTTEVLGIDTSGSIYLGDGTRIYLGSGQEYSLRAVDVSSGGTAYLEAFDSRTLIVHPSGDTSGLTDYANINAAHATLVAGGIKNGKIVLTPGEYYIRGPAVSAGELASLAATAPTVTHHGITLSGNDAGGAIAYSRGGIHLQGAGMGLTVIRPPDGAAAGSIWYGIRTTQENARISGIVIDGVINDGVNAGPYGRFLDGVQIGASYLILDDVGVLGAYRDAFTSATATAFVGIVEARRCYVRVARNRGFNVPKITGQDSPTTWRLINCLVGRTGYEPGSTGTPSGLDGDGIYYEGNTMLVLGGFVETSAGRGITFANNPWANTVEGTYFENNVKASIYFAANARGCNIRDVMALGSAGATEEVFVLRATEEATDAPGSGTLQSGGLLVSGGYAKSQNPAYNDIRIVSGSKNITLEGVDYKTISGAFFADNRIASPYAGEYLSPMSAATGTGAAISARAVLPQAGVAAGVSIEHSQARTVTDAAITSGTATLTSATAAFTQSDVGAAVAIIGSGSAGGTQSTYIAQVSNSTTAVLGANASTTVTGATAYISLRSYVQSAAILAYVEAVSDYANLRTFLKAPAADGGALTELSRWRWSAASGATAYLGLGTTVPHHKLDVAGDLRLQGTQLLRFGGTGASDDVITLGQAVGSVGNYLDIKVDAATGAEELLRVSLTDSGGYLRVLNHSATNAVFAPVVNGLTGSSVQNGLMLRADISNDTGTTAVMGFRSQLSTDAMVATRPLFRWSNYTTGTMEMDAVGNLDILLGGLKVGSTMLFESDRDLAVTLTPNADATLNLGSSSRRFAAGHISGSLSIGTNPAQSGGLRLANATSVSARNAGNTADVALLNLNASDALTLYGGAATLSSASAFDLTSSGLMRFGIASTDVLIKKHTTSGFLSIRLGDDSAAGSLNLNSLNVGGNITASTDNSKNMGTSATRWGSVNLGTALNAYLAASDANPSVSLTPAGVLFGPGGATAQSVQLAYGAADRLDLASGDSFNIVAGALQFGGTTLFEADSDLAVSLIAATDNAQSLGTAARRWTDTSSILHSVYASAGDAQPTARLQSQALTLGAGGATSPDTAVDRVTGASGRYIHLGASIGGSTGVWIDTVTPGLILKDAAGTPRFWRITVTTSGNLTTTDLGTSLP